MATLNGTPSSRAEAIDWLFSQLSTPLPSGRPLGVRVGAPQVLPGAEPEPPPLLQSPADLRAANEWLQRERERLHQYTEIQVARLQEEHQTLISQTYLNEQKMILACQELSQKEDLLARQSRSLQQQAAELSRREQALAEQLAQRTRMPSEGTERCSPRTPTELEVVQQQELLDSLRAETVALQKTRAATETELEALARALDEQQLLRAREQAITRRQQEQLERRLRELEQAEQAAQRRMAELDELEIRLRDEFEEQERQLAEQRRDLEALYARLRGQVLEAGNGAVQGPHWPQRSGSPNR